MINSSKNVFSLSSKNCLKSEGIDIKILFLVIVFFVFFIQPVHGFPEVSPYEEEFIRITSGDIEFGQELDELENSNILSETAPLAQFFKYLLKIYITEDTKSNILSEDIRRVIELEHQHLYLMLLGQELVLNENNKTQVQKSLKALFDVARSSEWKGAQLFLLSLLVPEYRYADKARASISLLERFLKEYESEPNRGLYSNYYPIEVMLFDLSESYRFLKDFRRTFYFCQRMSLMSNNSPWYYHYGKSCSIQSLIALGEFDRARDMILNAEKGAFEDKITDAILWNNVSLAQIMVQDRNFDSALKILDKNHSLMYDESNTFATMPAITLDFQIRLLMKTNKAEEAGRLLKEYEDFIGSFGRITSHLKRSSVALEAEHAFFLKDYSKASRLYKKAYDLILTRNNLHVDYYSESGLFEAINSEEVLDVKKDYELIVARQAMWIAIAVATASITLFLFYFAINLRRQKALLQHENKIDSLTKVFNRKHSLSLIQTRLKAMGRKTDKICIALIDIDHFKRVNDSYGHNAGDSVLKGFAKHFKNNIRDVDVFGRYGGEEFILMLGDSDLDTACQIVENIRTKLLVCVFDELPKQFRVNFSSGIVQLDGDKPLEVQVNKCDELLYKAKKEGRGRSASN